MLQGPRDSSGFHCPACSFISLLSTHLDGCVNLALCSENLLAMYFFCAWGKPASVPVTSLWLWENTREEQHQGGRLYFGPQFKSTAHYCGKVMRQEFEGRGTTRFRKRNGNRNCPDEEFRWSEERNGLRKAGGACLNQGRSFDSRQNGQETRGEQMEIG